MVVAKQNVQKILGASHRKYVLDSSKNAIIGTGKELLESSNIG